MLIRHLLLGLLVGALGLPILTCVVIAVAKLLDGMNDAAGALALERIGLGLFILWAVDLIGLVIVQAIQSSSGPNQIGRAHV